MKLVLFVEDVSWNHVEGGVLTPTIDCSFVLFMTFCFVESFFGLGHKTVELRFAKFLAEPVIADQDEGDDGDEEDPKVIGYRVVHGGSFIQNYRLVLPVCQARNRSKSQMKWRFFMWSLSVAFGVLAFISLSVDALGSDYLCSSRMLNPVTDVCWPCMYPIKIGGKAITSPGVLEDVPDQTSSAVCSCPLPGPPWVRVGITLGYWEPAAYIETVKSPWCLPALGFSLHGANMGLMAGTNSSAGYGGVSHTFAHSHYFRYPIFSIMGIMTDISCAEAGDFSPLQMTEMAPFLNDDMMMAFSYPEAVLLGNPIAQMACIADSVAANAGYPLAPLFWCMGSWGSAYPLTNNISNSSLVEANAGIAARTIYRLSRFG